MADKIVVITQPTEIPVRVTKWKVKEGNPVSIGRVIFLYDIVQKENQVQRKFKASQAGTVHRILAQEGDVIDCGKPLLELKACSHPTVMKDMCAECGADLRKEEIVTSASVPMVHSVPELKVSEELARKLGQADNERLLKDRKLVLLVDLDQTLIHTTNDNIPPNIKDVYHFQLYGSKSMWYHTRLRPGTHTFLKNISSLFELHICTFGARNYAHMIANFLDQDGKYFSHRILSRDECFNPTSKTANLKALFPCGDDLVCIIDDREDVWSHASNLIHVKPYHFFQHTGDINAPPGLDKHESDDKDGVDLTKLDEIVKPENVAREESIIEGEVIENENIAEEEIIAEDVNVSALESVTNEEYTAGKENSAGQENVTETENSAIQQNTTEIKSIAEQDESNNFENNTSINESTVEKEMKKSNSDTVNINGNEMNVEITNKKEHSKSDELIEIPDPDNYLITLEKVLRRIHKEFFERYDKMESGEVPDLKVLIPLIRSKVLSNTKLVFSGLVATHIKLENSKAYRVAKSLGAEVTQDLQSDSTHLVAVRPRTAKVNAGRRKKGLFIVTPEWLWACAESWEKVDEKLFPLSNKPSKNRHPPPHCSSPEHVVNFEENMGNRKRTPSGRFMDTINPLMSFSTDDIADMDREVEDIFNESESESEKNNISSDTGADNNTQDSLLCELKKASDSDDESSSSSAESLTGESPKGWRKRSHDQLDPDESVAEGESTADESPSAKFRRGEELPSDLDVGEDTNSEGSAEAPDEIDDGDWNMMGAALEREFLSNN